MFVHLFLRKNRNFAKRFVRFKLYFKPHFTVSSTSLFPFPGPLLSNLYSFPFFFSPSTSTLWPLSYLSCFSPSFFFISSVLFPVFLYIFLFFSTFLFFFLLSSVFLSTFLFFFLLSSIFLSTFLFLFLLSSVFISPFSVFLSTFLFFFLVSLSYYSTFVFNIFIILNRVYNQNIWVQYSTLFMSVYLFNYVLRMSNKLLGLFCVWVSDGISPEKLEFKSKFMQKKQVTTGKENYCNKFRVLCIAQLSVLSMFWFDPYRPFRSTYIYLYQ